MDPLNSIDEQSLFQVGLATPNVHIADFVEIYGEQTHRRLEGLFLHRNKPRSSRSSGG